MPVHANGHNFGAYNNVPQQFGGAWPPHSYPPLQMQPNAGYGGPPQHYPPHMHPPAHFGHAPNSLVNGHHRNMPPMGGGIVNPNAPSGPPEPPASPIFPSSCVTPTLPPHVNSADVRSGVGVINWLSTQAGLIRSEEFGTVSFQLKSFCDQQVADLTTVVRPGYKLKFNAMPSLTGDNTWNATFVCPVQGNELSQFGDVTAEIEKYANMDTGPPQLARDPYDADLEARAIPMLLAIFERQQSPRVQLSGFHCHISNCGDDPLFRYVGTSSLKRRQFLERRTHLFHIDKNDLVSLQPSAIYVTVYSLHKYLLARGGACLLHELWEHFNNSPALPIEAREAIGDGKGAFLSFLNAHDWIMSVFPSKVFVSVRRQLPEYDYPNFISSHFADHDMRSATSPPSGTGGGSSSAPIKKPAPVGSRGDRHTVSGGDPGTSSWRMPPHGRQTFDDSGSPVTSAHWQRPSTGGSLNGSPPSGIDSVAAPPTPAAVYWHPRASANKSEMMTPALFEQAMQLYRRMLQDKETQTEPMMSAQMPPSHLWGSGEPFSQPTMISSQPPASSAQSPLDQIDSLSITGSGVPPAINSIWAPTNQDTPTLFAGGMSKAPAPPVDNYNPMFNSRLSPLLAQSNFGGFSK